MIKEIRPFKYSGSINIPSSKSYLQRAIAIAGLANGESRIIGVTKSEDFKAAISIIQEFGANVQVSDNELLIQGGIRKADRIEINCGEAGLSTRMFSPIAATLFSEVEINGSGSMLERPMNMVIDALNQLGADVRSKSGFLPLVITGNIHSNTINIDGSESSQLLTGLLIALALLDGDSVVQVSNLKSIPYVQMTLDILMSFGVRIEHDSFNVFRIAGGQKPSAITYYVEGDWSGASFHVVGAAISGEVKLNGLSMESAQADRAIIEVVKLAGGKVEYADNSILIRQSELRSFDFDATNCPDLFPPIAALAACCEGVSRIVGTDRLAYKESDRAKTIQSELGKLGIEVVLKPNVMEIIGGPIKGGKISSNNDHRIAMMGAILATVSEESIIIENPLAINKSYPGFYEDITNARAL